MNNLNLMKAGIGLAAVIDIALAAAADYALFTTFGGIDDLAIVSELLVSVLFGGLTVTAAVSVHRVAPKPRTRV